MSHTVWRFISLKLLKLRRWFFYRSFLHSIRLFFFQFSSLLLQNSIKYRHFKNMGVIEHFVIKHFKNIGIIELFWIFYIKGGRLIFIKLTFLCTKIMLLKFQIHCFKIKWSMTIYRSYVHPALDQFWYFDHSSDRKCYWIKKRFLFLRVLRKNLNKHYQNDCILILNKIIVTAKQWFN